MIVNGRGNNKTKTFRQFFQSLLQNTSSVPKKADTIFLALSMLKIIKFYPLPFSGKLHCHFQSHFLTFFKA